MLTQAWLFISAPTHNKVLNTCAQVSGARVASVQEFSPLLADSS